MTDNISRRKALRRHRSFRRKQRKTWCFVYALHDHLDCPFYIGQTRQLLDERLRWHKKTIEKKIALGVRLSPCQKRLVDMWQQGTPPKIVMVDKEGIWDISEAVWIDRYRRDGHNLLNIQSVIR